MPTQPHRNTGKGAMNSSAISPREAAFHEAGHAVAALRLGMIVTRATIHPPVASDHGEIYGECAAFYRPVMRGLEALERIAPDRRLWLAKLREARHGSIVAMAGEMAGACQGLSDRDHRDQLLAVAEELFPTPAQQKAFTFRVMCRTAQIVNDHWRAIEEIAEQLLEQGELSGRRLKAIYRRCPADPQLPRRLQVVLNKKTTKE